MTAKEILEELRAFGDEKMKAHNIKKGVPPENQIGVKMGDIRKVAKNVKKADKSLAMELWNTRIIEGQFIATLLLKPAELSLTELDHMIHTISYDYVADWFNSYIVHKHPEKEQLGKKWMESDNKWELRSAWSILASKITKDAGDLDLGKILDRIEKEMANSPKEVQWTMNFALAHTGIYHPAHRDRAIAIGNSLGIYKDYPVPKGCTSPFAPIWINEMVKRQEN